MRDFNKIQDRVDLVTDKMLELFPNCHYTIRIWKIKLRISVIR